MSSSSSTTAPENRPKPAPAVDRLITSVRVRRWARRRYAWAAVDAATWFVAVWVAAAIRRLYVSAPLGVFWLCVMALVTAVVFRGAASWRGLYDRGRVRGSYDEVMRLVQASLLTGLVTVAVSMLPFGPGAVAGTIPVLATLIALSGTLSLRLLARVARARISALAASQVPTIVLGAGAAARELLAQLRSSHDSPYQLVALLDDDSAKLGARVGGMRVLGDRSRLAELTWRYEIRQLLVCIADAEAGTLRGICADADRLGLDVLVLPSESERLGRPLTVSDFRKVRLDDLVGRARVSADDQALRALLGGKRVLVTGAGGALGAEITRRLSHLGAGPITVVDIDQPALHAAQLDVHRLGNSLPEAVIADVRDPQQVNEAFDMATPDVVIHAAAVHDAPRVEALPEEAWRTNVIGTANVLESARAHEASVFVNVSSYAADNPRTTLGASELLAERLTRSVASNTDGTFISVRLPDLVGVRHGALPVIQEQLRRDLPVGGPEADHVGLLRVSDAAQLVLEAVAGAHSGSTYTVHGGQNTGVEDVAQALAWSGSPQLLPQRARRSTVFGQLGQRVGA